MTDNKKGEPLKIIDTQQNLSSPGNKSQEEDEKYHRMNTLEREFLKNNPGENSIPQLDDGFLKQGHHVSLKVIEKPENDNSGIKSEGYIEDLREKERHIEDLSSEKAERIRKAISCGNIRPYALDANFFHYGGLDNKKGKVSSIITILSVWNCMIGSSTVSMPKCIHDAGIIATIIFNIIMMAIAFYTARIVVITGGRDKDFSDTVERYFGKKFGKVGRYAQIIFNFLLNLGAVFIYFVIINQNLYPVIAVVCNQIGTHLDPSSLSVSLKDFSLFYCGIILSAILFPLTIMKNMSKLVKINSTGVYFVTILLLFEIGMGIYSLVKTSFKIGSYINSPNSKFRYLYLFSDKPCSLLGTLSLGYYTHGFSLSILSSNANQKNNMRDLFLGYVFTAFTYIIVGIFGYIAFSGDNFSVPEEFYDNWFRFFSPTNIFVVILRLLNVYQLVTVFPIVVTVVRTQLYGTVFHSAYPSILHVVIFSIILFILCWIILYFCANMLGKLIGIVGAITGLFLIYVIPLTVGSIYYKRTHPENLEELQKMKEEGKITGTEYLKRLDTRDRFEFSDKPYNKVKNVFYYIAQGLILCIGIFVLIVQFVPINIFGVKLKEIES